MSMKFFFDLADMADLNEFKRSGDPKVLADIAGRAYIRKDMAEYEAVAAANDAREKARKEEEERREAETKQIREAEAALEESLKTPEQRASEARYYDYLLAQEKATNTLDLAKSRGVENFFDSI